MRFDKVRSGKIMRELRGKRTLAEVASVVGVTASAMSMYENGTRIPRDSVKVAIADYYGKPVSYIFFGEEVH